MLVLEAHFEALPSTGLSVGWCVCVQSYAITRWMPSKFDGRGGEQATAKNLLNFGVDPDNGADPGI